MGRSQQRKGRNAEIELAHILRAAGYDAKPGSPENFGREPDITGLDGVHIECKRHERLEIPAWMKQARQDAERFGGIPAVVFRTSRQPWRAVMELADFLRLYDMGLQSRQKPTERSDSS